jgi:ribose 5-phosphate isomerase B
MEIAVGGDHAGYELKQFVAARLREAGHVVSDKGATDAAPSDYPDFAEAVGDAVAAGEADRGILICGSGVGVSVAANKIPGVRAGLCHDAYSAHQGVEHDEMNVLVLGARVVGTALAGELVDAFVAARFSGEQRHVRRLAKVKDIERKHLRAGPAS